VARELAPFLAARHPSQLYQAAAEGLVLGGVLWWVWRKPRRVGVVGCWFLITYGVMRIVTEFWRLPDGHLAVQRVLGLSRGQWLSAVMVVVGAALMWHYARREGERLGGWMEGWKARRRTA
jgi:phosphatidylglycerol:prolipoprotein diacylglycerol transferase